jgi:hypothetical protein
LVAAISSKALAGRDVLANHNGGRASREIGFKASPAEHLFDAFRLVAAKALVSPEVNKETITSLAGLGDPADILAAIFVQKSCVDIPGFMERTDEAGRAFIEAVAKADPNDRRVDRGGGRAREARQLSKMAPAASARRTSDPAGILAPRRPPCRSAARGSSRNSRFPGPRDQGARCEAVDLQARSDLLVVPVERTGWATLLERSWLVAAQAAGDTRSLGEPSTDPAQHRDGAKSREHKVRHDIEGHSRTPRIVYGFPA